MRKLLPLLVIGLLAAGPARAQLFRPGWVLPAQGDTLRGEVEDDGWDEAPTRVRFRLAAGAAVTSLAAGEVRAFQLTGKRYFRRETLPLDREARNSLQSVSWSVQRNPQLETFLAEVLVDGSASLLRTSVNAVQHYFVRRTGQPVLELAERKYLRSGEGPPVLLDGNNYRAELTQYFGDCPAAVQAIGAFQVNALVKVVQAYNRQCATPPQAGTEYRPAARQRIGGYAVGLAAGVRYSSCLLRADQSTAGLLLDGYNLDGEVHLLGGLFADISTSSRRFALHTSALLTSIGHRDQLATSGALAAQLNSQRTMLEMRLGGRYFWAINRQENYFFVGTGMTIPVTLGGDVPTLVYYDARQQAQQQDYLQSPYPSSPVPYLELGLRKGRYQLAVDGRVQQPKGTYTIHNLIPQSGGGILYLFSNTSYSGRAWYVGATLGVALLWKP